MIGDGIIGLSIQVNYLGRPSEKKCGEFIDKIYLNRKIRLHS